MKKTSFSTQGQRADIGHLQIRRMLANRYTDAVGPFVFLDHLMPSTPGKRMEEGTGAHPHRGIATLTYVLEGETEHFDSAGNHARVQSGGIQWMKAGNGVIHDETLNPDRDTDTGRIHGFQFWINLPAVNKAEKPEYLAIQQSEVPLVTLPEAGWLKVIAGEYSGFKSAIPSYMKQFLYHIHLEAGAKFSLNFDAGTEVAALLPAHALTINEQRFDAGEFVEFDHEAGEILFMNDSTEAVDVLVFGGEPYTEPIVAEGPFVMNSHAEIAAAYRDFYNGKYGEIEGLKSRV